MPDCPDAPDGCYYVVLVQHTLRHINDDQRIITKSFERANQYCSIIKNAYASIHEPYMHLCQGCDTNQCQMIVKLMHVAGIWLYNSNMIYYQDKFYEDGLCNAEQASEFNNQNVRESIIRHGGECLVL